MLIFKLLNFVLFVQVEICVTCANDLEAERIRSRKLLAPRRKVAKFGGERYTLLRMIFTNFHRQSPTFATFAFFPGDIPTFGCSFAALGRSW